MQRPGLLCSPRSSSPAKAATFIRSSRWGCRLCARGSRAAYSELLHPDGQRDGIGRRAPERL